MISSLLSTFVGRSRRKMDVYTNKFAALVCMSDINLVEHLPSP